MFVIGGFGFMASRSFPSLPDFRRAEEHVVRAPKFERGKIQLEGRGEFLSIPRAGANELLVVLATLVPAPQQ
jgi:hypothetical protein